MDRYQRVLRIDDLKPCPVNIYNGWYGRLLGYPSRVLADWARAFDEYERFYQPLCESLRQAIDQTLH
jgi:hypothetical protein